MLSEVFFLTCKLSVSVRLVHVHAEDVEKVLCLCLVQLCQRWSRCCCRWRRRGKPRGSRRCLWTPCFSPASQSDRWTLMEAPDHQKTPERASRVPQTSEQGLKPPFFVCFRSWRTVWFSLWPDAPSLPTVSHTHQINSLHIDWLFRLLMINFPVVCLGRQSYYEVTDFYMLKLSQRNQISTGSFYQLNVKCCVLTVCIWALHFLSTSEEVQDKLYQELEEVFGSDPVSLDKIPQLRLDLWPWL